MLTDIKTYLPKLQEQFPTIHPKDIRRAVEYGWRMFYYYNLRGCDTLISSTKYKYWFYCGELTKDSVKHFSYYKKMLRRKLRALYVKGKVEWDGYYYIGLTDLEYAQLLKSINGRGRKKKHFEYNNKIVLKVFDEAKIFYSWSKCIIRLKYVTNLGYSFHANKLKCTDVQVALTREKPSTFKDILISSNNYELIKYEKRSS